MIIGLFFFRPATAHRKIFRSNGNRVFFSALRASSRRERTRGETVDVFNKGGRPEDGFCFELAYRKQRSHPTKGGAASVPELSSHEELNISPKKMTSKAFVRTARPSFYALLSPQSTRTREITSLTSSSSHEKLNRPETVWRNPTTATRTPWDDSALSQEEVLPYLPLASLCFFFVCFQTAPDLSLKPPPPPALPLKELSTKVPHGVQLQNLAETTRATRKRLRGSCGRYHKWCYVRKSNNFLLIPFSLKNVKKKSHSKNKN